MDRTNYLAARLEEVLLTGRWIANTNFKEQIESLNWKQATQKIGSLNTIASLVYHINYYLKGLSIVLKGGGLNIRDEYSFEMKVIQSDADWESLKHQFFQNTAIFISEVLGLNDGTLDDLFVEKKYGTYLRNIEGVIEHSYYHLGQVVLIKKLVTENSEN